MTDFFSLENIEELQNSYRAFGPLISVLLPFLESFLPFLPLFVFVVANASAYGLWIGFLLSWGGSVAGAYVVFLIVRRFGQARFLNFMTRHERVRKLIHWVDRNGFGPLFLLLCFPFTPSSIVNVVAGLSGIKKGEYLLAVLAGKFVMILTVSYVGYDIRALITQPGRTAVVITIVAVLYVLGKVLEKRLNAKADKEFEKVQAEELQEEQEKDG
ncbi:TVP38/TMEM64 family protein [Indiicoccus explosivorum]|uniref:TVP38/TMEM64 family protein n=1 Tax=Indiicoccus explosivorum TaxID=1917864 RepID=UPI000B4552BF|nr:TVP38/TMEM64 family protein [Indiicoccus explosivorum]